MTNGSAAGGGDSLLLFAAKLLPYLGLSALYLIQQRGILNAINPAERHAPDQAGRLISKLQDYDGVIIEPDQEHTTDQLINQLQSEEAIQQPIIETTVTSADRNSIIITVLALVLSSISALVLEFQTIPNSVSVVIAGTEIGTARHLFFMIGLIYVVALTFVSLLTVLAFIEADPATYVAFREGMETVSPKGWTERWLRVCAHGGSAYVYSVFAVVLVFLLSIYQFNLYALGPISLLS